MSDLLHPKKAICFGEILWDNLPSGRLAGGAPMNVAYHLRKLGLDASLMSRVGDDEAGKELANFVSSIGIPSENIQIDSKHSTSEVLAEVKTNNEMVYTITYPTAWDFIAWQDNFEKQIATADVFVFGSLAARNEASKKTLLGLLQHAQFSVFDVNLRAPHYNKATISELLSKADFAKLNENEIVILGEWFTQQTDEKNVVKALMEQFALSEILITKGAEGGTYYNATQSIDYKAEKVEVVDTVGSGDSFLAAFLSKKLAGETIEDCLTFAAKLAGFITSQKGACPSYDVADIAF
ncbi:carbohydrate kinase family protein [Pedobacter xixiisoli]|uniref:Fructokinase n=1 Tax=Pedobacter xixiisoli TaxID=1476464 RepID=A0A286A7J6_9SPHI|nr:carbohydrate kinase [Pedobacter xixiisoli]SOD17890.1 fructokinase [Pedobacter xixiisoli]